MANPANYNNHSPARSQMPTFSPMSPATILKTTFENLDLVTDHTRTEFRLGDSVTCYDNLVRRNINFQESDDDSYVTVLSNGSVEHINKASHDDYQHIVEQSQPDDTNLSSLSEEQLRERVVELLQENKKLKTTLTHNKHTMMHHFNTLERLQRELVQVHASQQEKFAEKRATIAILTNQITQFDNERTAFKEEKTRLEEEKQVVRLKQEYLADAEGKVKQLKRDLERRTMEMEQLRMVAMSDREEVILLRQQLKIYEEDFKEEQETKESLLRERDVLRDKLGKLRGFNQQLLETSDAAAAALANQPRVTSEGILVHAFCDICGMYKMSGKAHGPGSCQPRP